MKRTYKSILLIFISSMFLISCANKSNELLSPNVQKKETDENSLAKTAIIVSPRPSSHNDTIDIAGQQIPIDAIEVDIEAIHEEKDLSVLKNLPNLERVIICNISTDNILDLADLPHLVSLSIYHLGALAKDDYPPLDENMLSKLENIKEFEHIGGLVDISMLSDLVNLEKLYLTRDYISDITPLKGLTNLSVLHLYENNITDIDPLAGLVKLTELDLVDNEISDLSALANLKELRVLKVSCSGDVENLDSLSNLTNLTELWISCHVNDGLSDINALLNMKYMKHLDLSYNQIQDISVIGHLESILTLNLEDNKINDINPIAFLRNLQELNLDDNDIADLAPISDITSLTDLSLVNNRICDLKPLSKLTNLVRLDLRGNDDISDLSPLMGLINLKRVNISKSDKLTDNDISKLQNALPECYISY